MSATALRFGVVPIVCATLMSCGQPVPAPGGSTAPSTEGTVPQTAPAVSLAVPGTQNRMPSLAVLDNRVVAVWTSTVKDVMDVYAAVSEDGGGTFSEARRVNDRPGDVSSNAEQAPRVALSESAISVIWPSRLDGTSAIRLSRSTDGGRTFSAARTLHNSAVTGARGWQSLTAGRGGVVHAVWLDGRDAAPSAGPHQHHGATKGRGAGGAHAGAPRQDVYQTTIAPDGAIVETHIARDVCFCCKTAIGVGPSGRVNVAWRHIFPESMRDIAMAVSTDGGRTFSAPARVNQDNWQLSGCPDDGPAMVIDRRDVAHLAWPTLVNQAAPQKAIVYISTEDGRAFAPRVRLSSDTQEDAAHPQIAVDGAGVVGVVWDEQRGDDRKVIFRRSSGSGSFAAAEILNTAGSALNPFVVGLRNGFVVAWPESSNGRSSIRVRHIHSAAGS